MTDFLTAIFSNHVVAFIIVVGVVVFVHELGHFLAAIAVGIRVEEFSLGFGPKAFGFRRGGVEYKICWLPLGGYVRLYGAEPGTQVPLEQREEAVTTARLWKRALVSLAGPIGNLLLTFCVMVGVANYGVPYPSATIAVMPGTVAWDAGLRDGDLVVSINGEPVRTWNDLEKRISTSPGERLLFEIVRDGGKPLVVPVTPAEHASESQFGEDIRVGRVGITFQLQTPRVTVRADSPFAAAGIRTGDLVRSIDGQDVRYFHEIDAMLHKALAANRTDAVLTIERPPSFGTWNGKTETGGETKRITVPLTSAEALKSGLVSTDLMIGSVLPDGAKGKRGAPAAEAWSACGVKPGVTIVGVEGYGSIRSRVQLSDWKNRVEKELTGQNPAASMPIAMTLLEGSGTQLDAKCTIPVRSGRDNLNRQRAFVDFPFDFASNGVFAPPTIVKSESFIASLSDGLERTWELSASIVEAIGKLVTGRISMANLGGPIEIARVAGEVARGGFLSFVQMIGVISTNLGLINLFPLPVLDGGTLLLIGLEAAYGRPLPQRIQQVVFQVGVLLIVLLMLTVFYNDILRLFQG